MPEYPDGLANHASSPTSVLRFLRSLFSSNANTTAATTAAPPIEAPPTTLRAPGAATLDFAASLQFVNELPVPDWNIVWTWIETIPSESDRAVAWSACEAAWLQHLRAALGSQYRVRRSQSGLLLSSLDDNVARATLGFMDKTLQRIMRVLDGIASKSELGSDILIVVDDEDTYYRYVDRYYHEEEGEFAASGGMHINAGCGHFVTMKNDLHAIEPVIAHEMTHGCLGHLPIPAWLNEGIAVNTEQRLCPPPRPRYSAREMHEKHRSFWGPAEIQQFWSGKSFLRNDDGNMLSYDLARILVDQFARDWPRFRAFVVSATLEDAGAGAAQAHLGLSLGTVVAAILELDAAPDCDPGPETWTTTPEKGAFRRALT